MCFSQKNKPSEMSHEPSDLRKPRRSDVPQGQGITCLCRDCPCWAPNVGVMYGMYVKCLQYNAQSLPALALAQEVWLG